MKRRVWSVLLPFALLAAACTGGDGGDSDGKGGGGVAQRGFRIVVVTHGQASDPFWSIVANGVDAAAKDMGVTTEYRAPGTFDMVQMSQLIDAAVASQPDGLIVSIPDADALGPSIQSAIDAGIPVVSINSGSDVFAELGVLAHVGQNELVAGQLAGERMKEAGVTKAVCVNQEVGNVGLDLRCQGFEEGFGSDVEVVPVDLNDPGGITQSISGLIQQDPDINGILTLGPTASTPAIQALQEAGRTEDITLATFDLSTEVLNAIDQGDMLFAVDQLQYLQGYLGVTYVTQYLATGAIPAGSNSPVGATLTGPQFVTQETAADTIKFTDQGVR